MLEKPLDEITADTLRELAARQVTERRTLDYKRDLNFQGREARKEFVADVLSFANAAGGDIVFGMDEARDSDDGKLGYPAPPVGTSLWAADDEVKRALEQCIRDSSEPRVPHIDIAIVNGGFPNGRAVIVRVERSSRAPHRSLQDNAFYSRATTGKYQLDVAQLRALFVDAAAQQQRIHDFVRHRVSAHTPGTPERIASEGLPIALHAKPTAYARLLVHVVSSGFGDRAQTIDVSSFPTDDLIKRVLPPDDGYDRWTRRHNFEGVLLWRRAVGGSQKDPAFGYRQIYRHGALECVDAYALNDIADAKSMSGDALEEIVLENCRSSTQLLGAAGCAFPYHVFVAVTGVGRGIRISHRNQIPRAMQENEIDRRDLALPDVVINAPDADIASTLRPAFDALWQAGGWPRSPCYAADGTRSQ